MTGPELTLHDAAVLPLLEPAGQSWQHTVSGAMPPDRLLRKLSPELSVSLVHAVTGPLRHLTAVDAARLSVTESQLFDRAFANLYQRRPPPFVEVGLGLYSAMGDAFTATRLVLPQALAGLKLWGQPVVFLPNQHTVFVTGKDDVFGLVGAAERIQAMAEEEDRLTHLPLLLTDYGLCPWLPSTEHQARPALEQLVHQQLARELDTGGVLLSRLLPQCAAPTIGTRASVSGEHRQVVVALDDAPDVLLPRADEVRTANGTTLSWKEFAAQNAAVLSEVAGANGAWFRLSRGL
jgi:hypothetical protein